MSTQLLAYGCTHYANIPGLSLDRLPSIKVISKLIIYKAP